MLTRNGDTNGATGKTWCRSVFLSAAPPIFPEPAGGDDPAAETARYAGDAKAVSMKFTSVSPSYGLLSRPIAPPASTCLLM